MGKARQQRRMREHMEQFSMMPLQPETHPSRVGRLNRLTELMYRQWLYELAMQRFKWNNLPQGMDARWLENVLTYEGVATLFEYNGEFFSMKTTLGGSVDFYHNPVTWSAVGDSPLQPSGATASGTILFNELTQENAVLVWDSYNRSRKSLTIEQYAMRLAELERIRDVNLKHRKNPIVIETPEERSRDAQTMWNQMDSNQPVVYLKSGTLDTFNITALNTDVPYFGNEIEETKLKIWNEVYTFLGINNANTEKRERLVVDEANTNNVHVGVRILDGLIPRQQAAERFNEMYGTNIEVEWQLTREMADDLLGIHTQRMTEGGA